MIKIVLLLLLYFPCIAMLHSDTAFAVYIIRESELGRYDTTLDTVNTVFDFDNKYVVDGRNYPKPKYFITQLED